MSRKIDFLNIGLLIIEFIIKNGYCNEPRRKYYKCS